MAIPLLLQQQLLSNMIILDLLRKMAKMQILFLLFISIRQNTFHIPQSVLTDHIKQVIVIRGIARIVQNLGHNDENDSVAPTAHTLMNFGCGQIKTTLGYISCSNKLCFYYPLILPQRRQSFK